ncbi:MAG TPA: hydroxymethylglutaryl-CoA lyase [Bacillus sp. (in: firmicutes)]|uniref:hydroxymethylglutaryl-CoA lyase n=1 Tax=Bacillus litorisediminis TaxID=2922713 RepID=UPI0024360FBE|nr:hydroxymethylglutaryl-CoA lyase [Bacillus litorisediminis]HWO75781.1 hydroxymethylglutaryl-CoA lyase [Bacillus sp. (in: firmicutes)]
MTISYPKKVTIIEVGPRDGLQNEKQFVPTEIKTKFITALSDSGISEMEITSFVSPKWVPQMKDASDIVRASNSIPKKKIVLVPNEKGIARALEENCNALAVFVGVSDTFNKKNINKTTKESLNELIPTIRRLKQMGIFLRACISTAFYCPFEGKIEKEKVIELCQAFVDSGIDELSVADTIGMANPIESYDLFTDLKSLFPNTLITAHFHDTRKMALANILASLQAGVDRFDSSAGGLGGCPFAPGATGNVATEDVVFMLHQMGIETGIDLAKLLDAIDVIASQMERPLESAQYKLHLQDQLKQA